MEPIACTGPRPRATERTTPFFTTATRARLARLDGPVLNKADSALVEGEASQCDASPELCPSVRFAALPSPASSARAFCARR